MAAYQIARRMHQRCGLQARLCASITLCSLVYCRCRSVSLLLFVCCADAIVSVVGQNEGFILQKDTLWRLCVIVTAFFVEISATVRC